MKKFIIIFILLSLTACDIFNTRDAEDPEESRSNYTTPSEEKILIQNLVNSFSDKDANNYVKSFTDPAFSNKVFFFLPSSSALQTWSNIWIDWDVDKEFQYFQNLVNAAPEDLPVTLSFTNEYYNPLGDSLIYTAEYFISIPQLNNDPLNYSGNVKFGMVRDMRDTWAIYFWQDNAISDSQSWSDLKGTSY